MATRVITPTIQPGNVTLITQSVQVFSASFGAAAWAVNGVPGGNATIGTIDSTGSYRSPAIPPSPNTVTITATSTADASLSASTTAQVVSPLPAVSSLSPNSVRAGSSDTVVTVTGSGFTPQSTVQLGATALATSFVSTTELTVTIPATEIASTGTLGVSVATPSPGGGTSGTTHLTVTFASTGVVSTTANPLVANYSINLPRDGTMSVEFGPDTNYGFKTWGQPVPTGGGTINMLVAGMKSASTYHMRAILDSPDGSQAVDSDKTFTTGTVDPAVVPVTTVTNPSGLMPSPGVLMGHLLNDSPASNGRLNTAAFDTQGNLIWYYDPGIPNDLPQPVKLLPNGHLLVVLSTNIVREIDLAGNVFKEFGPTEVTQWLANAGYNITISAIHHDFLVLPNGHLILLVNSTKDYDSPSGYTGTTVVLGDVLVDLDPNYNVAWVWQTFDHLDVNRHPSGLPDWTHSNGVIYSPDDGNLILSIRAQSWVIKIDYQDGSGTGNIIWRLGYQGDFTIDSGLNADWQFAQHYPSLASPNSSGVFNLMAYDNGDDRFMDNLGATCGPPYPTTFNKTNVAGTIQCYSRAVNFQVDENTKIVHTAWVYNAAPVYSFWGGSTQLLSTGNYVVDLNTPSVIDPVTGSAIPPDDYFGARYLELTPDPAPQIVMQMEVSDQNAYRLVHMPSLYPGVQW